MHTRRGDTEKAHGYYQKALIPYQTGNTRIGVLFTVEGFAALAIVEQQWEKAVKLLAWATKVREDNKELRPPVEQASIERELAVIHGHITDTKFTRLADEGRTMNMDQAIACALGGSDG
ncbi:MAG TPA: hypothetical protein VK888_08570 [Anaerolineales bacterium]|nr:hypothetical protein [Anaerolineales bacterium]